LDPLFPQAVQYRLDVTKEARDAKEARDNHLLLLTEDVFRRIEKYMREYHVTIKYFFHLVDLDHGGTIDCDELHWGVKQCCNIDLKEEEVTQRFADPTPNLHSSSEPNPDFDSIVRSLA